MKTAVQRFKNISELSRAAADLVCREAAAAVQKQGRCTLALCGGKTPRRLYELLAAPAHRELMPWPATHLFWGDERFVPATDPDSNFRTARELLIAHVPLPPQNVHRIPTDDGSPAAAAAAYEKELKQFFSASGTGTEPLVPAFDVILLGVGSDGHTASLFPGDAALRERSRWVAAVSSTNAVPPVPRVTITLPVINACGCVVFLVSGGEKLRLAEAITNSLPGSDQYPAALVKPAGRLYWLIDENAS
jgi:6-phosphogluconolactonase